MSPWLSTSPREYGRRRQSPSVDSIDVELPDMNVARYLARIGYSGPTEPNSRVLADLMRRNLERVPFENLDVDLGIPIDLAEEAPYDKVVLRGLGGFCYELNGLFAWLLEELGFKVDRLPAVVYRKNGSVGPDDGHMALLVHVDEGFLVDVGFGESHRRPIRWRLDAEHIIRPRPRTE